MVRKGYYIFVFTFGLIKMDPVFSYDDVESTCIEDSEEAGPYGGLFAIKQPPIPSSTVVKEENTGKPTELKKPSKKRGASCFFLKKRKALNDGK